ncbi:MAG: hypothetical protein Q7S98_02135 [Deltaproteobacteria bacterium]|nr:hypothetical protein [Deltaproteobacteria bacterium]
MGACCYCRSKAGFFKKVCPNCLKLEEAFHQLEASGSFGYNELLDTLLATGAPTDTIDKFLEIDVDGKGSPRNRVTARMTNEVMGSLGIPSDMKPEDVKKVRETMAKEKKD